MKTRIVLPALLLSAAFITPAFANWFHNPIMGINRNIGSAPNPTPEDIRLMRVPIVVKKDEPTTVATDEATEVTRTASASEPSQNIVLPQAVSDR